MSIAGACWTSRAYAGGLSVSVDIPGRGRLDLNSVVLDVNGTLSDRGRILPQVPVRLARVAERLRVVLASADTFGTLAETAASLGVEARSVSGGRGKVTILEELGPEGCAMIGNGANDVPALEAAALGIAVLGPEGASAEALAAADVVCLSILDALDVLVDERALVATLRR